ncbi:dTMP kinase [Thermaurantiacus sp.]
MFIAIEGGEGAGKSTQIRLLADRLRGAGHDVVTTREPGGTPGAEAIRRLLVEGEPGGWTAETEALLVNAARAEHVARVIRPALQRGAILLCDRFIHSTLAYQGAGRGLAESWLRDLHRLATGDLWPDLALFLDVEVEDGLRRAAQGRFEAEGGDFHRRIAEAFRAMDLVRIDASGAIPDVAARVWAAVASRLS